MSVRALLDYTDTSVQRHRRPSSRVGAGGGLAMTERSQPAARVFQAAISASCETTIKQRLG